MLKEFHVRDLAFTPELRREIDRILLDERLIPPLDLMDNEVRQVFDTKLGRLRSDTEQITFLRQIVEQKKVQKATKTKTSEILMDYKKCGIVHEGRFFSVAELSDLVTQLTRKKKST